MKKALAIILLLTVLLLSACDRNTTQQASLPGIVIQGTETITHTRTASWC